MTELDSTQFQRYSKMRENFSDNLEAMPDVEREKLDYIWVAVHDGKAFPQFLDNGEELKYSKIKELKEDGSLDAVYFVPLDEDKDSIGVEAEDTELRLSRRGYPQVRTNWLNDLDSINDALYHAANNTEREEFKHRLRSLIHNDGEMKVVEELHRFCYLIEAGDEVAFISDHGEVEVKEDWNYDMKTYKDEDSQEWREISDYE